MTASHEKQHKNPKRGARTGFSSAPVASTATPFKSSLADSLGDAMAAKLKRHVEDGIKKRIRDAMNDPKVQEAGKKFLES